VDAHGNPINKRNAWATRAVVYVRLIPPGAADTVHFRMKVPSAAGAVGNKITLTTRLCYRKFVWWGTQFAFAGVPDPNQPMSEFTPHYDDRKFVLTGSLLGVSAKQEKIPDLPIVVVAHNQVSVDVFRGGASAKPKIELRKEDWQRWNDYGIGLLLQGDLKAAQAASKRSRKPIRKIPTAG
jgi:hypothetical protein